MRKKNVSFIFLCLVMFLMVGGTAMAQSITVTSPAAGATWYIGTGYNITWSKVGSMDANVKITLYNPTGTTKIADITDNTANDGSYGSWTIPAIVSPGSYVVRVKTLDNAVFDDSSVFTIANAPAASITVTSPGSVAWCRTSPDNTYNITWTKTGSMHASVKITLYDGSGTTKQLDITDNTANDGSFSWTIPGTAPTTGTHVVRVKTLDNAVFDDSVPFTIKDCSGGDGGIDWDAIRDKIRKIIDAQQIPWWRKGPWPWPPDPNPCLSCEFELDFDKIRDRLNELGLKDELRVELFGQDGRLGDLGMIGKGRMLKNRFGQGKLSQRLQNQLVSGKGFKLVFKNKTGEIIHTQAIQLQEKVQKMR